MGICIMQRAGVMLCNYHVKEYSERREMFITSVPSLVPCYHNGCCPSMIGLTPAHLGSSDY